MADIIEFPLVRLRRTELEQLDWSGYSAIPEHTRGALERYVFNRYAPGGFLIAVLANDLMTAIGRADDENIKVMREICNFVYNRIPVNSWGTYEAVDSWLNAM